MAAYTQYNGSNSQTAVAQRLLDNGSDYVSLRTGQYQYVMIQGDLTLSGNRITYSDSEVWVYTTSSTSGSVPTLTYNTDQSGTVTVSYPAYLYSSLSPYQHLDVMEVTNVNAFTTSVLIGLVCGTLVMRCFGRIRNRLLKRYIR